MKNLSFTIWMIFFPFVCSIDSYLTFLKGTVYSDDVELLTSVTVLAIWFVVGYLLFDRSKNTEN
ncbi:hypothetical protein [Sulfurimonas sp.]|uniref:hypothetical protein n=1 Tax=Sulfurimonas sp. TaxID=2022749 RepID=UPI0026001229|nr:hypothetical protein [Sulfurimonas sp.]